jgi:hypothetical protein
MHIRPLMLLTLVCACLALTLVSPRAHARRIEDWPYDKLSKHASLVVIVQPLAVREAKAKDGLKFPGGGARVLTGIVTTFKVLAVVKGEHKNEKLEIAHFRVKDGVIIANGPLLVYFHNRPGKGETVETSGVIKKNFMLFLKKDKSGRLEFVSGQMDPSLSVREMVEPSPFGGCE